MRNKNTYENSGELTFTLPGTMTTTWYITPVKKTPRKPDQSNSTFSLTLKNLLFKTDVIFQIDRSLLGEGSYGSTKLAKKINSQDWSYVIKRFRVNLGNVDSDSEIAKDQLSSAANEYNHLGLIGREAYLFYLKHEKTKTKKNKQNNYADNQQYTHTIYLIMPYLGDSLHNFLVKNNNRSNFSQKLELAIQLINIVIDLHEKKIAHGDIKPSNITIDKNRNLHLIDFGTAKTLSDEKTYHSSIQTYPYYPDDCSLSPRELDRFSVFRSIYGADTTGEYPALSIFTAADLEGHDDLKKILDTSNNAVPKLNLDGLKTALMTELKKTNPSSSTNSETIKETTKTSPHLYKGIILCFVSATIFTVAFSGILPAAVTSLAMLMLIVKILAGALALFGVMNLSAVALASTPCCRA